MGDVISFSREEEPLDLAHMGREALEVARRELREKIALLDEQEPEDMESEEYELWGEQHEALEDQEDEILDRLDELAD